MGVMVHFSAKDAEVVVRRHMSFTKRWQCQVGTHRFPLPIRIVKSPGREETSIFIR